MKRRLFNSLSALSLLLCLGALEPWLTRRSSGLLDVFGVTMSLRSGVIEAKHLYEFGDVIQEEDWTGPLNPATMRTMPRHDYGWFGLILTVGEERRGDGVQQPMVHPRIGRYWLLRIPIGFVVLIAACLPVFWLSSEPARRRREYRIKRGLCLRCGYDLRASEERCPECGTAIPAQDASSGGKA